jgi:hypothetical protein
VNDLKQKLTQIEYSQKRDNLRFYGIPEDDRINAETALQRFLKDILKMSESQLDNMMILRAYRIGPFKDGQSRTMVGCFQKQAEILPLKKLQLINLKG